MSKLFKILSLLLLSSSLLGQVVINSGSGSGSGLVITNVAGLATIPGKTNGTIAVVTNGANATDCTAGGGTNVVNCQYNGSTWSQIAAAGSGGTTFPSVTGGTNTNALVMGTGGSLTTSGTGTITATGLSGTPSITINALTATTINGAAFSGSFSGNPTFTGTPVFSNVPTFPSQTANFFFAAPNGSSGSPTFRAIVANDIPTLNQNTSGTAANLSGTPALPNGTTATTQTLADNTTKIATDAFVLANAGSSPSGTQGLPLVNTSGSTTYATSLFSGYDVSQFSGADWAAKLAAAINAHPTGGIFSLVAMTGNQVAASASLTSLDNAFLASTGTILINLGSPAVYYYPLQSYGPSVGFAPKLGAMLWTPWVSFYGVGSASVAANPASQFAVCTGTNEPVATCTAPSTHEFTITSTAITTVATTNPTAYRTYMAINGSGMDIQGGEPVHINAGGANALATSNLSITGAYTVCQTTASVIVSSFTGTTGTLTFTNTGTINGLSTGSTISLSSFSTPNTGLNGQTITVTGSPTGTTFAAAVTGSGYSSGTGLVTTGSNRLGDSFCPANPTGTTVYVPVVSGATASHIISGGTGGTYGSDATVSFSGGGCYLEPTGTVTTGGGVITAFTITTQGKGCTSAPAVTVNQTTGTGTGANLTVDVAGTNMSCGASCNSIVHADLPMIDEVDSNGVSGTATFSDRMIGVTMNCNEVADCVQMRFLGANEHNHVENINFAGALERAVDAHSQSMNGMDRLKSVRVIPGNQPNQIVPSTASGTCTVTGGTLCTQSAGNTFNYGNNSGGSPVCNYVNGTEILIDGVPNTINSCSSTVALTLNTAVSNASHTFYIPGCDAGVESFYFGDGGPHGLDEWTADYSACPRSVNYPYSGNPTTAMQVPNWALRVDTYYWAVAISNGHAEQTWTGQVYGDASPARGVSSRDNWGAPNPFTNVVGEFQNEQPVVAIVFPEYFSTGGVTTYGTTDYTFSNIVKSFNSFYTIVDNNPVGPNGTVGPAIRDGVTTHYGVDQGSPVCETSLSSGSYGAYFGCGGVNIFSPTGSTTTPLIVSGSLTGAQTIPTVTINPTWNTTGIVDAALLVNPTNTASATGSLLADFQLGGVSQETFDKAGNIKAVSFQGTGSNGGISGTEGTGANAGTPGAGTDILYPDSTLHDWHINSNNVDLGGVVGTTGTQTLQNKTIQGAAITGALTGTGAYIPVTLLNSGTSASSSTFWRGDGTWAAAPLLIASGTSAMGTGAITSGTCASAVTTTATGATTSDNLVFDATVDPTGVTGYAPSASGSLYIQKYLTSGNVNFKVCNNTSGTITPSALTLQWRVLQ